MPETTEPKSLIGSFLTIPIRIVIWLGIAFVVATLYGWFATACSPTWILPSVNSGLFESELALIQERFQGRGLWDTPAWDADRPRTTQDLMKFNSSRWPGFRPGELQEFVIHFEKYLLSLFQVVRLFEIRIAVIVAVAPLVAVAGFAGLVDGLVLRNLRRRRGGRESALRYHVAKRLVVPSLSWVIFLYLTLPFVINPFFLLVALMTLSSTTIWYSATYFKKYV